MATVLDGAIGLLKQFDAAFAFLLIFVLIFAVLNFTDVLKAGPGINAIAALSIAVLALFIPTVTKVISSMTPWFVVFFILIIFVLVGFKLFGVSDSDITDTLKAQGGIKWVIIIVMLVIFVGAISSAYGPGLLPATANASTAAAASDGSTASVASGDFSANAKATIFHPKVVGVMFILLLGTAAIGMLGAKSK